MSDRELVVLGTASQAPTRSRNHNGYLLLWDDEGLLFDPGEGTQRQMLFAGVAASRITRICITHFHGDHCLGLPGVLARMSLDRVPHPVEACYPAQNQEVFTRLRHAALFRDAVDLRERPAEGAAPVLRAAAFGVEARPLSHTIAALGYRLAEADGRRMLPDRLAAAGITGPDIGRLQREGRLVTGDRLVTADQVSEPRRGQRFAFIMDTRLCDAAFELADGADMVVCESTFADTEAGLAREYGHLTAGRPAASRPSPGRGRSCSLTSRSATSTTAAASSVPPGPGQQVLHPVRSPVPGMLGDRPAVLARQLGQQAQHERPGPAPRLHPAEPGTGPGHQLIECPQPAARVYAGASGHQKIIASRHKPG